MRTDQLNRSIHSHTAAMLLSIVAVCGIITGLFISPVQAVATGADGLGLPPAHTWITSMTAATGINIIASIATAFLLYLMNREFKLMRENSEAVAGIFMIMQMALPQAMYTFSGGTLMALVMLVCTFILFGSYNIRDCSLSVFTIFLILGLGGMTFYGYLIYVPVFIAGCLQVRILSLRTVIAAVLGMITPPWILMGFGLVNASDIALPDITTVFAATPVASEYIRLLCTAGFTALICLICGIGCIMRTYRYNSQARSYNGFIYLLTLCTIVMSCLDISSAYTYLPLLNCCAAYQFVHSFITNSSRHSFIYVTSIVAAYLALYIWNIL